MAKREPLSDEEFKKLNAKTIAEATEKGKQIARFSAEFEAKKNKPKKKR